MSTSIHEVAVGAQDLSVRTEKQAAALQQTSATMAEISTTVKECGTRLQQADQLSREARIAAQRSEEAVGDVARGMEGIHASSKKIGDITGIIDGIAFQTNILSLNAAVEAARAGEQGRGFAVVAAEVRSLAQRTAAAAKEIQALIRDASAKVIVGVGQAEAAGLALTETMHSVQRVSTLIAEVSSTFGEQETGVVQVEQAIAELDSVTQQNAAMVEQSAATAASVSDQSRSLVESVATFRLGNELLETQATAQ
jgi:methyl-accepting chemotaxis protein